MKRILQIQFSRKSGGSVAWKLHQAFLEQPDLISEVLTLHWDGNEFPGLFHLPELAVFKAKLNNRLHERLIDYDKAKSALFSVPLIGTDISEHECVKRADIIYVHWVQMGFMTLRGLEKLIKTGKRIVFFMHDMWCVTGGCHNSLTCEAYEMDCANCPVLNKRKSVASKQLHWKESIFDHDNVSFVSPSKWLKGVAEKSLATRKRPIFYIPNYFNSKNYAPQDKIVAKNKLGINSDVKVISCGAVNLGSSYKGFEYLLKALNYLPEIYDKSTVEIVIFGDGSEKELSSYFPYRAKFLGYLNKEEELALAYGVSDVFVIPSIADNQPTVIVESLACGVPVVGFEVGGIPDMIQHKSNGYLARFKDYKDLAEGIKYCLEESLSGYQLESFDPKRIMSLHQEIINE